MAKKAPGKAYRKGLSLVEIMQMFPDDATAERWFADARWPNGPACPHCGSENVQSGAAHPTMPYRCRERECRKRKRHAQRRANPYRKPYAFGGRIQQHARPVALHEESAYLVVRPPSLDLFVDDAPHGIGPGMLGLVDRLSGTDGAHEALVDFLGACFHEWNGRVRRTGSQGRSEQNHGRRQSDPYLREACH